MTNSGDREGFDAAADKYQRELDALSSPDAGLHRLKYKNNIFLKAGALQATAGNNFDFKELIR
jgi:hypothetical protein